MHPSVAEHNNIQ